MVPGTPTLLFGRVNSFGDIQRVSVTGRLAFIESHNEKLSTEKRKWRFLAKTQRKRKEVEILSLLTGNSRVRID